MKQPVPLLVSACLVGVNCRYDGSSNRSQAVIDFLQDTNLRAIPICPEQLGGLPTPRPKAWFTQGDGRDMLQGGGRLIDENGQDAGPAFARGAEEVMTISRAFGCASAILKQRSPSCGSRLITRNGELTCGVGITCARLRQAGLKVVSEEDFEQLK